MSSSDRRTFLKLVAAVPLGACGFTPAYAPGGPAAGLQGTIRPDDPTDKLGYDLVVALEARLGRSAAPKYKLGYTITTDETGVGITTSNATTRYEVTGSIAYRLSDAASGTVLTSGTVDSFTSFSAAGSPVMTLTDEEAARTRLMDLLADQIVTRLIATSGAWSK
jgi:LPS-assembly lipoprotein